METTIMKVHDLSFKPYMEEALIQKRVSELGRQIKTKHQNDRPIFLAVLNGAFVFAADLIRACEMECEISFIKLASYKGTKSSGTVQTLIGLDVEVANRPVIIIEDIIDSGRTLHTFLPELEKLQPKSIEIAALLLKPDALEHSIEIQYLGFEIPPKFVIGYGLDYNGLGRNIKGIYQLVD